MIDKKLLMNSIKAETDELANQRVKIHKDCMNRFKNAVETVRMYKREYLLSRYGVAEPSQRQPVRNKKEIQK